MTGGGFVQAAVSQADRVDGQDVIDLRLVSGDLGGGLPGTAPTIADLTDAPTADDFNGLLAALRARGVLAGG